MHVEELPQDQPQHPHQQPQHPHPQLDADLPNGPMINGVTMKTTTLIATGMVALVVTMILEDGTHTAQPVNVLNHQLQPLQLQPPQQQPQPPLQVRLPRQLQLPLQVQQPLQFQQPNLLHLESVVRSKITLKKTITIFKFQNVIIIFS